MFNLRLIQRTALARPRCQVFQPNRHLKSQNLENLWPFFELQIPRHGAWLSPFYRQREEPNNGKSSLAAPEQMETACCRYSPAALPESLMDCRCNVFRCGRTCASTRWKGQRAACVEDSPGRQTRLGWGLQSFLISLRRGCFRLCKNLIMGRWKVKSLNEECTVGGRACFCVK